MSDPTIEVGVALLVGGFAFAFVRDACLALRGASGQTAHWVDASRAVRFRGRRLGAGAP